MTRLADAMLRKAFGLGAVPTHSNKVCLATQPCDLRKSFDTLCVEEAS